MVLIDSFASGFFFLKNNTKKSRVENHYNVQISTSLLCEKKRKGKVFLYLEKYHISETSREQLSDSRNTNNHFG